MKRLVFFLLPLAAWLVTPALAAAGPIFLTGHDPDFHAQDSAGARNLLRAGLRFVTDNTYNLGGSGNKFLWVESRIPTPGGHRVGEAGLNAIGLVRGTHYDRANAAELGGVNFADYRAIAIASNFGGLLTRAELNALIARSSDIASYINAGGGLLALAECDNCGADLLGSNPPLFGYLPITVSSIAPALPFVVTPAGAAAPFFLTNGDVNDPTHNSFGLIGGLIPLDRDQNQQATTLAGNVTVSNNGFNQEIPEPASLAIWLLASAAAAATRLRMRGRRAL